MKCVELEALICDYVDGTLSAGEAATVELHLEGCEACRELVADSRAVVEFMSTAAEVEPPAALVNRILHEARQDHGAAMSAANAKSWIGRLLEPVLQPKFAMGMAMTILSFSMLARFAGIPIRPLKASDLEPARIWATLEDKSYRSYERAKKYYESLRLVYEIQQTFRDWNETADGPASGAVPTGAQAPAGQKPANSALEGPIEATPQEEAKKSVNGRASK